MVPESNGYVNSLDTPAPTRRSKRQLRRATARYRFSAQVTCQSRRVPALNGSRVPSKPLNLSQDVRVLVPIDSNTLLWNGFGIVTHYSRRSTSDEVPTVVKSMSDVAAGIRVVEVCDVNGDALPTWEPGAHVEVILGGSLVRHYSLCSNPLDRTAWRFAVLREPASRGGSAYIHDELQVGDNLELRGPRNNFVLGDQQRFLFIAGGIGITPLLPMIDVCHERAADWHLVYGGRSRETMAFAADLAEFGSRVTLWPEDEAGLIDLDSILGIPLLETAVYCCGPEVLLAAVEKRCRDWPAGSLHVERFKPRPRDGATTDAAFEIELRSSGLILTVSPDKSIVDVIRSAGVYIETGCEEGVCGTCETMVLDGVPDHRDSVLTPDERSSDRVMMPCRSRAKTKRLTLGL